MPAMERRTIAAPRRNARAFVSAIEFAEESDLREIIKKFKLAVCNADPISSESAAMRSALLHLEPRSSQELWTWNSARVGEGTMKIRWLGMALTMGWLGMACSAWAQAPLPEPLPIIQTGGPGLVPCPGPAVPAAAGMTPPANYPSQCADTTLPASIPGAFTDNPPDEETGTYFHIGPKFLQRERPAHQPVAIIDHNNPTNLDTGAVPASFRFVSPALEFSDIHPGMTPGVTSTLGYLWGGRALEVTGFWVGENPDTASITIPGRLDLFFHKPPLGFEGDNGLWLQADHVHTTLRSSVGNVETNFRWWNVGVDSAEGLIGLRYLDQQERLNIFTDDDGATIHDINGFPDPTRQASYRVLTHNHIVAPQLGFEGHLILTDWLVFSMMGKGAWGVDFLETKYILSRGDGFMGRDVRRNDAFFSQIYEGGFFFDAYFLDRFRVRAGYNIMWLVDVAQAVDQVNYNLETQGTIAPKQHSIFYHGPSIEFQFLF
jgi:hypothetical protein